MVRLQNILDPPIMKKSVFILCAAFLISACSGPYALVNQQALDTAEASAAMQREQNDALYQTLQELLQVQQQAQQQDRELQAQLTQTLNALDKTLQAPLRMQTPVVHVHVPETPPAPAITSLEQSLLPLGSMQMVGAVEDVYFAQLDITLAARIDTGATTSSIDAEDIEIFERDGKQWVRFKMVLPEPDEFLQLEQPLVRQVRVRQSISDEHERRPVIKLQITIGSVTQNAEFTLTDRTHLDYHVLIGRNVLRDLMAVDVSKKNLTKPQTN